jgi:hypothetical protein
MKNPAREIAWDKNVREPVVKIFSLGRGGRGVLLAGVRPAVQSYP